MYKKDLISRINNLMRENDVRKPVTFPRQTFTITDSEGTSKTFTLKKKSRGLSYTYADIEAVIDAFTEVVSDAIKNGETVSIRDFGIFGVKYRKARRAPNPVTRELMDIEARYVPKFSPGVDLKTSARVYSLKVKERQESEEDFSEIEDFCEEEYEIESEIKNEETEVEDVGEFELELGGGENVSV